MRLSFISCTLFAPEILSLTLPGLSPLNYAPQDPIPIYSDTIRPMLRSPHRLESPWYNYYDPRFHLCQPTGGPVRSPETFTSILFGDQALSTPFDVHLFQNVSCTSLCRTLIPKEDVPFINAAINQDYGMTFFSSGLPVDGAEYDNHTFWIDARGVNLGSRISRSDHPALNNYFSIQVEYHQLKPGKFQIVRVHMLPLSRDVSQTDYDLGNCASGPQVYLSEHHDNEVAYFYSVEFVESQTHWSTRWDRYNNFASSDIRWFWLAFCLVLIICLLAASALMLYRAMCRDIREYIALASDDYGVRAERGWK